MSIKYYRLAVTSSLRTLENLTHLLDIAVAYCGERKIEERVLLEARLFPDMLPFVRQVQLVSDIVKSCAARLAGKEPPSFEDKESSFAELRLRLDNTAAYLKTLDETDFAASADREISLPWQPNRPMRGEIFLLQHALPNIYFHVTTAYNILRHNGVAVGKADYIGKISA